MRYFLDTEFDGHGGPLLSLALVTQDGFGLHLRTTARAADPWVIANVEPHMDAHDADMIATGVLPNAVGGFVRDFIANDEAPVIVADSPVDIGRFCAALSTGEDGGWASADYPRMTFEVHDVNCYPTTLPGAVQHNAWWDAMALRAKLSPAESGLSGSTEPKAKEVSERACEPRDAFNLNPEGSTPKPSATPLGAKP